MSGRSLLGGAVVFGGAVEVVPGDPGSVEHRGAGRLPCALRAFSPMPSGRAPRSVRP